MEIIKKGIYEHYKGNKYEVIGLAKHTESEELLVVYKALYQGDFPEGLLWARPLTMFQEEVLVEGILKQRFRYLSPH